MTDSQSGMPDQPADRARHEIGLVVAIIGFFALSRIYLASLGIGPDPDWLFNHLQNVDITWLADDPLRTIWYLHAQPPLWNMILGTAAVLTDADPDGMAAIFNGLHIAVSLGSLLLVNAILRRLDVSFALRAFAAALQIVMPSIIFYENYIFYQHVSYGLFTFFLWAWLAFVQDGQARHAWYAMAALGLLAWLWSVFHPVLIVLLILTVLLFARFRWRMFLPAALAGLLFAALPSLKNAYVFDNPSPSSWLGMNLNQTTFDWLPAEDQVACTFEHAWDNAAIAQIAEDVPDLKVLRAPRNEAGWANGNHISVIAFSKDCLGKVTGLILADFDKYLKARLLQQLRSYLIPSYIYGWDPLNWEKLSVFTDPYEASLGPIKYLTILFFAAFWVVLLGLALRRGRNQAFFVTCLMIAATFTAITLFLNGFEQHRMRYTISQLQLVVAFVALQAVLLRLRP